PSSTEPYTDHAERERQPTRPDGSRPRPLLLCLRPYRRNACGKTQRSTVATGLPFTSRKSTHLRGDGPRKYYRNAGDGGIGWFEWRETRSRSAGPPDDNRPSGRTHPYDSHQAISWVPTQDSGVEALAEVHHRRDPRQCRSGLPK